MNHRERVLVALEHKTPDRPPLYGGFKDEIWDKLIVHYKKGRESIMEKFGFDFRSVGISRREPRYKELPDGTYEDIYGIRRKWVTTLSGHSPHWVIVYHPLENIKSMDEYEFPEIPDPTDAEIIEAAERIKQLREDGYAVRCGGAGSCFELACQLRGWRKLFVDMYTNPEFVNDLLDRIVEKNLKQIQFLAEVSKLSGNCIDLIGSGDDVGTQVGMMIRPEHWRKFIKPRHKKLIAAAKSATNNAYCSYHTDGKVDPIIPDLIEIGVDLLNPIQPDCMDPIEVKRLYGDKLTLERTISVQETLPFGTVEQVKAEVIKRIETCGYNGGLVLAPTHVVEPPTPIENIIALYETAQTYKPSWLS